MIAIEDLSKSFKRKEVLHSVNLRLDNRVYRLLGANGAGKTTLIRCIAGLYEPQRGRVLYDGEPIDGSKNFHRDMGYLPQTFGMFHELTLYEMMDYICSLKSIPKHECRAEIERALAYVNLENRARDRVKTLSGGMVRRAGIAQAIIGDSKIILMDEPTAGLDPGERARFKNLITRIKKGKTLLLSTHIVEDVESCCDNVIVIDEGRVLFDGPCEDLRNVAMGKVYQVKDSDLDSISGDRFVLRTFDFEGQVYHRVMTREKQDFPCERPSLEDGFMCVVRGFSDAKTLSGT